ncbi:MAG: THO complex subunit 2, partial [Amphiamblys sp. WSBS2006]
EFLAEACTADTDTLLNHIWVADHCGVSEEKKEKLGGCVLALLENKIIGEERLFLRMEPEMLERIGLITSSDLFKRKIIRKNTATLYKQNKFNLFREEPLGYGLVLDTITSDALPEGNTLETVVSLIGEYDLDPNRIAYMVLDMVQIEQRTKPLLNLLSGMNIHEERLLPLLSLKLQNKNTVRSTMSLCFFLAERSIIKHQSISLLLETDTEMDETIKGFFSDTLKHGKKLETVLLTQNALSNEFSLEDRDQRSPAQIHTKRGFYFKLLLEKGDLNAAVSVLEKTPCL